MIKTELASNPAAVLTELGQNATRIALQSLNRAAQRARAFAIRRTSEIYNLTARQLQPYLVLRRASRGQNSASLVFRLRAIPIEQFKPRIEMRRLTYTRLGRSITRRLATVHLQLFRSGPAEYVRPAFPLQQRTSGRLRTGEKIRRRIGPVRDRLTLLKYYTFPLKFLQETLLPQTAAFAGETLNIEFERAVRRWRGDRSRLVGNT